MSALNSISSNQPSNSQFIPLAKTDRGWNAQGHQQQGDQPTYRPIKVQGDHKPQPLPRSATGAEFRPIKPGQFGVQDPSGPIMSRKDLFTGNELNPVAVQGKSVEAEELRASEAAQKLVASTLVEPILKQLRSTNNSAAPFGPTEAEKQFGPILDAQIADNIVNAADFPLVERIKQDLLKNSAYMAQATQASSAPPAQVTTNPLDILG